MWLLGVFPYRRKDIIFKVERYRLLQTVVRKSAFKRLTLIINILVSLIRPTQMLLGVCMCKDKSRNGREGRIQVDELKTTTRGMQI